MRLSSQDSELAAHRSKVASYILTTEHAVTWDDVVGNEAARTALIEAVEAPTRNAALYKHYGARPPRGALLFGPPGCGKTMFAKAASSVLRSLYGGAGHEMIVVNGPQIQSPYVGVTEEIIRNIFAYARAYRKRHGRPLVVFVDECDAILPCRDGSGTGRRALPWEESNVATFLTEMDGMEDSGAFVLLATNRPDAIDPALLRDGRCDRRIRVERPGEAEAAALLARLLVTTPLAEGSPAPDRFAGALARHLFSPDHAIATVHHARGRDTVTLGALASGASVTGLVERAKGIAMRRDLEAGGPPTGVTWDDAVAAVTDVLREARAMPVPVEAVRELAEAIDCDIRSVERYKAPRIAFTPEELASAV